MRLRGLPAANQHATLAFQNRGHHLDHANIGTYRRAVARTLGCNPVA
jgi:hypothetical protein